MQDWVERATAAPGPHAEEHGPSGGGPFFGDLMACADVPVFWRA